jgi:ribonuclease BN (tRNA processing enzyme)
MRIRVLGASGSEGRRGRRPTAFLVDERTLVDAGSVTGALTVEEQRQVEHVLVSHSHLDHVAGLAFLTETLACTGARRPLTVAGIAPVVDALRTGVFNDVVWPDFTRIPSREDPVVRYRVLEEGVEHRVGDLRVTPVGVDHTVPAAGFIVHDGTRGFVYSGDTGPTRALWDAARAVAGIGAVILECSFPNRLGVAAECAKHLTPDLVGRELEKLPPGVPVWIFHIKPQFHDETVAELGRVDGRRIVLLEQDRTYEL